MFTTQPTPAKTQKRLNKNHLLLTFKKVIRHAPQDWHEIIIKLYMKFSFNSKTPIIIKQSIKIDAPVVKVWSLLTGINHWHTWQAGNRKAYLKSGLKEGAEFRTTSGLMNFKSSIHSCQQFHSFGWSKKKPGYFILYNWRLESDREATNVFVEQHAKGFFIGLRNTQALKKMEAKVANRLRELKLASEGQ